MTKKYEYNENRSFYLKANDETYDEIMGFINEVRKLDSGIVYTGEAITKIFMYCIKHKLADKIKKEF